MDQRTPADVISQDERVAMPDDDFDDELWLALTDRIEVPTDLDRFDPDVGVYFASRLVEWDTMNGGVAQAAFNNVEWFPRAVAAFEALGQPAALAFFKDAGTVVERHAQAIEAARDAEDPMMGYLALVEDPDFAALDERLEVEAEVVSADAARVAFVRAHRDAFRIA